MDRVLTAAPPAHPRGQSFASRVAAAFGVWRQRRALAALDDHILRDIGLTRRDVSAEISRPVWDAPTTWRQ